MADTVVTESKRQRKEPLTDLLVVDLDVHLHESPGELAPYCDPPWDVALENIKDRPETYLDIPSFSPGVSDGSYQAKFPTAHEGARMVHDQKQMRVELDELDVDLAILFPDHLLKLPVLTQAPYAVGHRAGLQRLDGRQVDLAGEGPARSDHRRPPRSPGCGARDREVRRPSRRGRRLPAVRRHRPAVGPPHVRPDLPGGARRGSARAAAQRHDHAPGLPLQQPRLRHRAGPPCLQPHVLDHGEHRAHDHHRGRGPLSEPAHRRHRGGHLLGAVPVQPARQGVPRAPSRRPLPRRAPEPLPQAPVLGLDPAGGGARGHARSRQDDRALRRRGPDRVRLRLAPPRLRPSDEGRPDPVPDGGDAPQAVRRERARAVQDRLRGAGSGSDEDDERDDGRPAPTARPGRR